MNHLEQENHREEIAIIGMSGRFPGAENVDEFWQNLCDGIESIVEFTADDLKSSNVDPEIMNDPAYVNAGAPLEDAECFDASFFGYYPKEAAMMDPQHRIFLECAWAALENAGYDPEAFDGLIGMFGGVARNNYFLKNIASHPDLINSAGEYLIALGSDKDFSVTRVSYKLNLRGPSINVQTACSTSGTAIHLACQSLLMGDCDIALAGGCRVQVPTRAGYLYVEGAPLSQDGHCRAFDAKAKGMVRGNGAAFLVLKRLEAALEDGDHIHAVIKSTALNNDGSAKIGFTAPSVKGQSIVIAEALTIAGIHPETIGYIETHGTGTVLGDPIEVAALTKAFRESTDKKQFCPIGSVKTNIGHLDAGACAAGVIKAAFSFKHGLIPASLNFERPNPQIDFENSPFYVNDKLSEWPESEAPRRAGINSLGLGGTNVHVIIEEPPCIASSQSSRRYQVIVLSAKTASALETATTNLSEFLQKNSNLNLADVAYTLQVGRRQFQHRRVFVCKDSQDASAIFNGEEQRRLLTGSQKEASRSVVFMFPGAGAQYVNMGAELYQQEEVFRNIVDECSEYLKSQLGLDLRTFLYPKTASPDQVLDAPSLAFPALFIMEYALAKLWMSWGIQPTAMIGHSMGEYTAACLAGVLSLKDALALVTLRGQLFEKLPEGSMLAVPLSEDEAKPFVDNDVAIAAINKTNACVLSGATAKIKKIQETLAEKEIDSSRLHISVAAHSPLVEPILGEFSEFLKNITFNRPIIPYVSTVTSDWITAEQATDPQYWVNHIRQTVRFSDGLHTLLQEPDQIFLEVGPGQTLSTFARMHPSKTQDHAVVSSSRHPKEQVADDLFLLNSLGRLWLYGAKIDWDQFYKDEQRRRVPLPTYPFERKRCWIEPAVNTTQVHYKEKSGQTILDVPLQQYDNIVDGITMEKAANQTPVISRKKRIIVELKNIIHDLSGIDPTSIDIHITFLELGFDSLFLTQANMEFRKKFDVKISFRQLFEEVPTLDALADFIDSHLAPEAFQEEPPEAASIATAQRTDGTGSSNIQQQNITQLSQVLNQKPASSDTVEWVIQQQLQVMQQQLAMLQGNNMPTSTAITQPVSSQPEAEEITQAKAIQSNKGHGPWKPVDKSKMGLTVEQKRHLDELIKRLEKSAKESKRLTQAHRQKLADPRTVAGFRLPWKELIYPIVATRSSGSKLWDVDGNEYLDISMGFGVNLFGHSPVFVSEAIQEQLKNGVEIGPQSPLAGPVAELVCEFSGMDRAAFCNTGSEAVLAAIRMARTVTGRTKIVIFGRNYHGLFDEVLVKNINGRSVPVAPGIPRHMVDGIMVLEYGEMDSLEAIRKQADELAAVVVEPVQSRHPDLQPKAFLQKLRKLTEETGVPLIFDEMITGFRSHPGGAQALFEVQADLVTYGKVIGGGFPIGVVAGKAEYMDALDGGMWQYGDDSIPEAGVTWFTGTFVRHPIALAAAYATLKYLKQAGPDLQRNLNERTSLLVNELNEHFEQTGAPIWLEHFNSLFIITFKTPQEFSNLIYYYLRDKGIHIVHGRGAFLSTAHSDDDFAQLCQGFKDSVAEMQAAGFLPGNQKHETSLGKTNNPEKEPARDQISVHPRASSNSKMDSKIFLTPGQAEIWLASYLGLAIK